MSNIFFLWKLIFYESFWGKNFLIEAYMFITLLFLPDLLIVSKTSHSVGTILVIINDDEHNDDDDNDDDVPYGAAADNNDRNVDAHSGDQNLALSDLQLIRQSLI